MFLRLCSRAPLMRMNFELMDQVARAARPWLIDTGSRAGRPCHRALCAQNRIQDCMPLGRQPEEAVGCIEVCSISSKFPSSADTVELTNAPCHPSDRRCSAAAGRLFWARKAFAAEQGPVIEDPGH